MFNLISIDPSIISTAVCVNGKLFNYCREKDAINKSGLSKWFKMAEHYVTYKYITYDDYDGYAEGEIVKMRNYDDITDLIISDIVANIDKTKETKVAIEGFSFASSAGDIIDLVTFSTLLRKKIKDQLCPDFIVLAPSTLKMESCKMSYEPINIGIKKEKLVHRNNLGVAGGKFTKHDMYLSVVENKSWVDDWSRHLREIKDHVFEGKKIPKPYEDLVDATLLYRYLQNL
jgi:hypothetical protein